MWAISLCAGKLNLFFFLAKGAKCNTITLETHSSSDELEVSTSGKLWKLSTLHWGGKLRKHRHLMPLKMPEDVRDNHTGQED